MKDLLERYVELAETLSGLRAQLAELRTAKETSAVAELWRKA
jgi:ribosomal protein L29